MAVTVVAIIKAKAGKEKEVKGELLALVDPTHEEEGCINYDLHQHSEDPAVFMFHENWRSKEDLDLHLASPHLENFLSKADGLLAEPADIQLFSRVS
jgi:quinol monooxygenase YgiN